MIDYLKITANTTIVIKILIIKITRFKTVLKMYSKNTTNYVTNFVCTMLNYISLKL